MPQVNKTNYWAMRGVFLTSVQSFGLVPTSHLQGSQWNSLMASWSQNDTQKVLKLGNWNRARRLDVINWNLNCMTYEFWSNSFSVCLHHKSEFGSVTNTAEIPQLTFIVIQPMNCYLKMTEPEVIRLTPHVFCIDKNNPCYSNCTKILFFIDKSTHCRHCVGANKSGLCRGLQRVKMAKSMQNYEKTF